MSILTMRELKRLTGRRDLKSDLSISFYDFWGLCSVRRAERRTERKYPTHAILRRAALSHFSKLGYHVYPNGVGPNDARACADLALVPQRPVEGKHGIIFVECLCAHFVDRDIIKKKRSLGTSAELYFVIEDRPRLEFNSKRDWIRHHSFVRRLASQFRTFWCRCRRGVGSVRKVRPLVLKPGVT
jgi:hypothetical protein